jgi:hypothetical protein
MTWEKPVQRRLPYSQETINSIPRAEVAAFALARVFRIWCTFETSAPLDLATYADRSGTKIATPMGCVRQALSAPESLLYRGQGCSNVPYEDLREYAKLIFVSAEQVPTLMLWRCNLRAAPLKNPT